MYLMRAKFMRLLLKAWVKHVRVYQENIPYPIPNETIPNQLRYCVNVDQFDVWGLSSWTHTVGCI